MRIKDVIGFCVYPELNVSFIPQLYVTFDQFIFFISDAYTKKGMFFYYPDGLGAIISPDRNVI